MRSRQILIIILLSYLCGFSGCGKKDTVKLTSDQKMLVQVYVDLLKVQEMLPPADPAYVDSCRQILARHKISKLDYERIVSRLNQKPDQWEMFYKQVLLEIDLRKSQRSPIGQ